MDLAAYWTHQLSRIFQTNWRWLVEIRKYEEIFFGNSDQHNGGKCVQTSAKFPPIIGDLIMSGRTHCEFEWAAIVEHLLHYDPSNG